MNDGPVVLLRSFSRQFMLYIPLSAAGPGSSAPIPCVRRKASRSRSASAPSPCSWRCLSRSLLDHPPAQNGHTRIDAPKRGGGPRGHKTADLPPAGAATWRLARSRRPERGSTAPPAPDALGRGASFVPLASLRNPRTSPPGGTLFPAQGGLAMGERFLSATDVGFVTGGLQPCSGPAGLGGSSCSSDVVLANLSGLTFLDSGALLKCVYRFSGRAFPQGAWGVVVKANEHQSRSSHVDHVTGASPALFRVSFGLGPT